MATINEFKELITEVDIMNKTPLVISLHGTGKSSVCAQYAIDNDMHYEPLILSLMDIGDLLGVPETVKVGGLVATTWAAPVWYANIVNAAWPEVLETSALSFKDPQFKQQIIDTDNTIITRERLNALYCAHYEVPNDGLKLLRQDKVYYAKARRSLLLLDEFNRAPTDILNASLQLVLDHRLHSHILPIVNGQETLIIAAVNPPNGTYTVQEFDPALLDRFVECSVEPSFTSWVKGVGENNLNSAVVEFLRENQNKLHFTPEDGTKGASPRSWSAVSDYITYIEKNNKQLSTIYIKGTIGSALAAQFISFYDSRGTAYSFKDLDKLIKNELSKVST